jgi:hypothetical protein
MKKLIGTFLLLALALFFNNCMPAYVQVEPTYIENPRPVQPTSAHIWIGGSWGWSNRNRGYVQQNGYWSLPHRGRTYREGHWQREGRGSRWHNGYWR